MSIKPMGDRIIVQADLENNTTAGGIFIAKKETTTNTGTVLAAGPDATEFTEGDRVIFVKNAGKTVTHEDAELTVLEIAEVIGVVNDTLQSVRDVIVCTGADFGDQQTAGGIIIKSNIKESQGITSRWMQVYNVGPDIDFLQPGDWVLVEYGRWTEGFAVDGHDEAYRVDPKGCMAVSDTKPETLYYNSDTVTADRLQRG